MISLLKFLDGPWETVRGYLREDLDHIEAALNQRWNAVFGDTNKLKPGTISGDATPATRYVANTGTANAPNWDQVNLSNGVTSRLPFANLAQALGPSHLLGRDSGSAGDFEDITLGSGLQMNGSTLSSVHVGLPGPDGDDGINGMPGLPGIPGLQGLAGIPGLNGEDGADGMGWPGPAGATGASGSAPVIQTTTSTGAQNDFTLTAAVTVLRCNNASLISFTGFTAGTDGQIVEVISIGAGVVTFAHQSASSSAANRFINAATSGITPLAAGKGTATFVYDATTARWRLVKHAQGDFISVTYASGDYTADAGTWTVDAGDVNGFRYFLEGAKLTVSLSLSATTTATVNLRLFTLIPNGYTISSTVNSIGFIQTPTSTFGICQVNSTVSTAKMAMLKGDVTAWADGTNNIGVSYTLIFPVD